MSGEIKVIGSIVSPKAGPLTIDETFPLDDEEDMESAQFGIIESPLTISGRVNDFALLSYYSVDGGLRRGIRVISTGANRSAFSSVTWVCRMEHWSGCMPWCQEGSTGLGARSMSAPTCRAVLSFRPGSRFTTLKR